MAPAPSTENAANSIVEAVVHAGAQSEEGMTEAGEEPSLSLQERAQNFATFATTQGLGRNLTIGAGVFLAATLLIALQRTYKKYTSNRAKRRRQINKNKHLVNELDKYLPNNRTSLTQSVIRSLRASTGFTAVETFRKYLWYLLRERKFDQAAVDDMAALKAALGLSDADVAEALRERAQRVYDKYGTLMMNAEGMTAAGLERKATCRALFQKLLYLTESEAMLAQGSEAAESVDLRQIFGATDDDVDKVRLVSLYDLDMDSLERLAASDQEEAEE